MFQVYRDFEKAVNANRNIDDARKLNPALQNFDQWLAGKKSADARGSESGARDDRVASTFPHYQGTKAQRNPSWEFGSVPRSFGVT